MAGLVPAIHVFAAVTASRTLAQMRGGWVYIMTNRPNGALYTGVTADIARRAYEHREGHSGLARSLSRSEQLIGLARRG
jgi:putative endonuclease